LTVSLDDAEIATGMPTSGSQGAVGTMKSQRSGKNSTTNRLRRSDLLGLIVGRHYGR